MKINFKFSGIYERVLNPEVNMPGDILVRQKLKMLEKFWQKKGQDIEKKIKEVTHLSFKKDLDCYINSKLSISDPLSLKILPNQVMKDNLIHELCHIILTQNEYGKTAKGKRFFKDFQKENFVTRIHILIHSMHYLIAKTTLERKRISGYSKKPEYVKAWKIALKLNPENLIKKYF